MRISWGLPLWLKRGIGPAVGLLTILLIALRISQGQPWLLDSDWGLREVAGATYITAPLVAGAVAFDYSQKFACGLGPLARSVVRGRHGALLPVLSIFIWAFAGQCLAMGAVLAICSSQGAVPPRDLWILPEAAAATLAAATVGMLVGVRVGGLIAAAVGSGIVLLAMIVLAALDIHVFQVLSNSGTMIGLERSPARAVAAIGANLSIGVACTGFSMDAFSVRRASRVAAAAMVVPVIACLSMQSKFPFGESEYRPDKATLTCRGDHPTICGPEYSTPLLAAVANDLTSTYAKLSNSGLRLPAKFLVSRERKGGWRSDSSNYSLDPSTFVRGVASNGATIAAISMPRPCAALFGSGDPTKLMQASDTVSLWLDKVLAGAANASAPTQVSDAYEELLNCQEIP